MNRTKPLRNTGFKRKAPKLTERGRRILDGTEPKIKIEVDLGGVYLSGPEDDPVMRAAVKLAPPRARMAVSLSAEQPRAEPKDKPFRSTAWLRAVRSIPCVFCGAAVQAAHRNEGKGMGTKTDDALTAALCPEHHSAIDQGKTMTRDERRAELDRAIVLTVKALARAGMLIVKESV